MSDFHKKIDEAFEDFKRKQHESIDRIGEEVRKDLNKAFLVFLICFVAIIGILLTAVYVTTGA